MSEKALNSLEKQQLFNELLDKIKSIVEQQGIVFEEVADALDYRFFEIRMTFLKHQEKVVDQIIRDARKSILQDDMDDGRKWPWSGIPYSVYKTFVRSHQYWGLDFSLADRYLFTEDAQA